MVAEVTERGLVRRLECAGGWSAALMECPDGVASLSNGRDVVQLFVSEMPDRQSDRPSSFIAAACLPEGEVLVLAREAPPALLVTPHGHARVPANAQREELVRIAPGEFLLLLSAAVFEDMPASLATLLHDPHPQLLGLDPGAFLATLLDSTGAGAGAVLTRPDPDTIGEPA